MLDQSLANGWAATVLKMFRGKILQEDAIYTGQLKDTLRMVVHQAAGGDVARIEFFYKLYGEFVNQGVGKEIALGNSGDLGFTPTRQAKRWYSPVFFREVQKLHEIIAHAAGQQAADTIVRGMVRGGLMEKKLITPAEFNKAKRDLGYL